MHSIIYPHTKTNTNGMSGTKNFMEKQSANEVIQIQLIRNKFMGKYFFEFYNERKIDENQK